MALTITASILDPAGAPLAQLDAQVCIFSVTGAPRLIGAGRTDASGKLVILTKWSTAVDYQPRLRLLLMRGSGFVDASEQPATFVDSTCDFGAVTFDPSPLAEVIENPYVLKARVAALEAEKKALAAELDEAQKQSSEELAARGAALSEKDDQIRVLGEKLEEAKGDAPAAETSIEDLAKSTAEQLRRVQSTLRGEQSNLRLGRVALQLKVLPGRTSGRVALPRTKEIAQVGASALGVLDLEFHPDAAAPRGRPELTMPRVLGYTEVLARRKLAERRLGVDVIHQLVTSAAEQGRVVLQRPAPAAPVAEGTTVLIAIGRLDEHDPHPS